MNQRFSVTAGGAVAYQAISPRRTFDPATFLTNQLERLRAMGSQVQEMSKTSKKDNSQNENTSFKIISDKFSKNDEKDAVNFQDTEMKSVSSGGGGKPPKKDDNDDDEKKKNPENLLQDDNLIQKTFASALNTAIKIKGQI